MQYIPKYVESEIGYKAKIWNILNDLKDINRQTFFKQNLDLLNKEIKSRLEMLPQIL